ncbi:hypothetical protein KTI26_07215 [Acinetobacter ursingii]|uniref:hypothetical protein n=1 Tax=Acinetobacter ursingii TaxID=108980 RepID=UPI0021CDAA3B|nr:hypothetical protein [Acinetobacter ursingii]MCU4488989.1 hypothetical protein [Acinetobacter ursingii]MCU4601694.1 hypothetical protein [Acinetobacter ursingii]
MTETKPKPPTQSVGVEGFKADVYANDVKNGDEKVVDWQKLIHLPKFQMFVVEQSKMSVSNVMEWIVGYVQDRCYESSKPLFDQYVNWHDAKGYWKNETVFGDLIEDK